MGNIKTAISIQESLFKQANELAREMSVSRSHLFALALEEFLRREADRRLLDQINATYADAPDPSEREQQRRMRVHHRRLVEGAW